jgi:putative oxidoreductase
VQRLFSTFASGWPGAGLLVQRILSASLLIRFGIIDITATSASTSSIPQIIGGFAGILLLLGLWTPVVGILIAVVELWIAMIHAGDPWISIILATLGATAAMIGPGECSLDARLYGRKHLTT